MILMPHLKKGKFSSTGADTKRLKLFWFRHFLDNLVVPEDSEIFVHVSALLELHESPIADMDTPENIEIDEGHDPLQPQLEKIQRITERNREVRASTSLDSIKSYESMKAEKHFQGQLNIRHYNRVTFTKLLRVGSDLCCYFQELSQ